MIRSDRCLSRMVSKHFYRKSQRNVFQNFHREIYCDYRAHIHSEKIGITFPVIKIQVILNYKESNRCLLGGPNALDTCYKYFILLINSRRNFAMLSRTKLFKMSGIQSVWTYFFATPLHLI